MRSRVSGARASLVRGDRRFVWVLAIVAAGLAVLPAVYAFFTAPSGERYIGYQYNTDDQMVYAAWMRQAMDGRFFLDNRFTTDPQPGLTVHVYFFLLGLVAKATGIALATTLARAGFSILFVLLADRLIRRLNWPDALTKIALVFVVFGGGVGYLVWHKFGQTDVLHPPTSLLVGWAGPALPVDVWQPEGFVFPSMLTNSLFMVSLCLILAVFEAFLEARDSWQPVVGGFVALGVLMNIHSYDTLMIGLVLVAFVAACAMRRQLTGAWTWRGVVIAAGMLGPALWFVHVLARDPVFQSRAATKTFSPDFRQVVLGYLPMMLLGMYGAFRGPSLVRFRNDAKTPDDKPRGTELDHGPGHDEEQCASASAAPDTKRRSLQRLVGIGFALLIYLVLFALGSGGTDGYFLGAPAFAAVYLLMVMAVVFISDDNPAWNLFVAWAFVGTIAIYFPGLFQRKLAMGLSIPWAILAAYGFASLIKASLIPPASAREAAGPDPEAASDKGIRPSSVRPLAILLGGIVVCASSLLWFTREFAYIRVDVSSTGRHPVYLNSDEAKILDYLNQTPGRKVVLAIPGSSTPTVDAATGQKIPDELSSPTLPDLAPIISGLTGAYSYAGHWSETPDYGHRLNDLYRYYFDQPFGSVANPMTPDERRAFASRVGANYAVVPMRDTYAGAPFVTPDELGGQVVVVGRQFSLVKLP